MENAAAQHLTDVSGYDILASAKPDVIQESTLGGVTLS